MTYSLAISLGHNSSAIAIKDGAVIGGYEEERFNGIKSSSVFPVQAIDALRQQFNLPKDTNTYVSHWFTDANLPASNKYWDLRYIKDAFPNGDIESLSQDFTHHDAHLVSAIAFAGGKDFSDTYTAIVADGFGSFGECISIYQCTGTSYKLVRRFRGFENSLGLLYQYATAFIGMKMHNHEYKMLAYEVHIDEAVSEASLKVLDELSTKWAKTYLQQMFGDKLSNQFDPVTNIEALPMIQLYLNQMLSAVLNEVNAESADERTRRIIISYFVQSVVQTVMLELQKLYAQGSLLVVGGLFYNVKLNHMMANATNGKFCAMPLAGDQGAALGVYHAYTDKLQWPGHLNWGHRALDFNLSDLPKGFIVVESEAEAQPIMHEALRAKGWINMVRGAMEFGPRALCHTSTISLPHDRMAMDINRANARTMEMPFAPVVTKDQAAQHFKDVDRVHRSLEYMIIAREFKKDMEDKMLGAAHYYPLSDVYTGRPQITSDALMVNMLNEFGPLINTSFNFHGVPIVNTEAQILHTHKMQCLTAPDIDIKTIVIRGK